MTIQLLAVDLGKQSFHVHGITADGVVVSRKVSRAKFEAAVAELDPAVVAMEACASAHHWGRRFVAVLSKQLHLVEWTPPSSLHPVRDNPGKRLFFAKNNPNWRPAVRPNSVRCGCFDNTLRKDAALELARSILAEVESEPSASFADQLTLAL